MHLHMSAQVPGHLPDSSHPPTLIPAGPKSPQPEFQWAPEVLDTRLGSMGLRIPAVDPQPWTGGGWLPLTPPAGGVRAPIFQPGEVGGPWPGPGQENILPDQGPLFGWICVDICQSRASNILAEILARCKPNPTQPWVMQKK